MAVQVAEKYRVRPAFYTDDVSQRWPFDVNHNTPAQREWRGFRIEQYRDYVEARNDRVNEIDRLIENIHTKMPAEIVLVLFDHLVRAHTRPLARDNPRGELGPPPIHLPTQQRYDAWVEALFASLPLIKKLSNKSAPSFKANFESGALQSAARKSILTQNAVTFPSNFPSVTQPDSVPYPAFLVDRRALLHHVNIVIDLEDTHYPSQLYFAQDHVHRLKEWFPRLKSVLIKIIVYSYDRSYQKRRNPAEVTNIVDEGKVLVKAMQKAGVKHMYLTVYGAAHHDVGIMKREMTYAEQIVRSTDSKVWFKVFGGGVMEVVEGEVGVQPD